VRREEKVKQAITASPLKRIGKEEGRRKFRINPKKVKEGGSSARRKEGKKAPRFSEKNDYGGGKNE